MVCLLISIVFKTISPLMKFSVVTHFKVSRRHLLRVPRTSWQFEMGEKTENFLLVIEVRQKERSPTGAKPRGSSRDALLTRVASTTWVPSISAGRKKNIGIRYTYFKLSRPKVLWLLWEWWCLWNSNGQFEPAEKGFIWIMPKVLELFAYLLHFQM